MAKRPSNHSAHLSSKRQRQLHPLPLLRPLIALMSGILLSPIYPHGLNALGLTINLFLLFTALLLYYAGCTRFSALTLLTAIGWLGFTGMAPKSTPSLELSGPRHGVALIESYGNVTPQGKAVYKAQFRSQGAGRRLEAGISLQLQDSGFKPGDLLVVAGQFQPFLPSLQKGEVNWRNWYHSQHTYGRVNSNNVHFIMEQSSPLNWLTRRKHRILRSLTTALSTGSSGLAAAIIIGVREGLNSATKRSFKRAGCYHILAVSGMHVGIVYLLIDRLSTLFSLLLTWRVKRLRLHGYGGFTFILTLTGLWLYCFLCGASPSVLRACTMFTAWLLARRFGLQKAGANSLLCAAFLLLLFDPALLTTPGFLLSFCAVAGILIFYPLLERTWQPKHWLIAGGWQLVCISISAQLGTLAPSLHFFGTFPTYFLLTNLLAVPLLSLSMYCGYAFLLLDSLFPILAVPWQHTLEFSLKVLSEWANFIASFKGAEIQLASIPSGLRLSYPLAVVSVLALKWTGAIPVRYMLPVAVIVFQSSATLPLFHALEPPRRMVVIQPQQVRLHWGAQIQTFSNQNVLLPNLLVTETTLKKFNSDSIQYSIKRGRYQNAIITLKD